MLKKNIFLVLQNFRIPLWVLVGMIAALVLHVAGLSLLANILLVLVTILGSFDLFKDTIVSLIQKDFALDYIALLAILLALFTGEFLVASVIALMFSGGQHLEKFGIAQARKSLSQLAERIPAEVTLANSGERKKIKDVQLGEKILVRKGEVIPLDGELESEAAFTDESSLTGEPYMAEKMKGDSVRSGTVNTGDSIVLIVTKVESDSTYHKIVELVQKAQAEKSPLVRLAKKYSLVFTVISFVIAGLAYFLSGTLTSILAVLVIATPCPLLLATPIALLGGVNASAKKRIIVKRLADIEVLSRINTVVFDKTGTITMGRPMVTDFKIETTAGEAKELLAIASAIERNSLHPVAKAIVAYAKEQQAPWYHASHLQEKIGQGISGQVNGTTYTLAKMPDSAGMSIGLKQGEQELGVFHLSDEIKKESKEIVQLLHSQGFELAIYTGDKKSSAEKVAAALGANVEIYAELTPEQKQQKIAELQKQKKIVAMVGDGINDAPALALADVGLVFSNEEQTASSQAADIVLLGGDFFLVYESLRIAKRTVRIAKQSILWGIGLSIVGMLFAAFGFIMPIVGAVLQEAIDVAVILNALRASR